MDSISLADGDLRWVFPDLDDSGGAVRDALSEADSRLRSLAGHLGAPPSDAASGLRYERAGGFILAGVFSVIEVEGTGVSFLANLCFPRNCAWDLRWGPPWEVNALVLASSCVGGDGDECGADVVVERERSYDDPLEAARGLIEAVAWLHEQGVKELSQR